MANDQTPPTRRPDGTMMPGNSANPRGRPLKSRNMLTLFNEKRDELIAIKADGKTIRMTRQEAWVTNLWNRAVALDPKASQTVLAILRTSGQLEPKSEEETDLSGSDAAALDAMIARLSTAKKTDDE